MHYVVLLIFAPLLIVVGLLGFVIPKEKYLTSGEPAYNVFHIAFGLLGLAVLYSNNEMYIRAFLIGFGLIDLYQSLASYLHLFPEKYFKWTRVDDVLHIVIGIILITAGLY